MSGTLTAGDTVLWSGTWGAEEAKKATVKDIERDCVDKEGTPVSSVPWSEVKGRKVIVTVEAGKKIQRWAYGFQIRPL